MRSNGERQVNRLTKWPSNCVSKPSIKEAPTMSAVWCFIWNDSERLSKHLHCIILIYTTSYVNRLNPDRGRQDLLTLFYSYAILSYIIYIFFLCNLLLQTNHSSFTRQTKRKSDTSRCARRPKCAAGLFCFLFTHSHTYSSPLSTFSLLNNENPPLHHTATQLILHHHVKFEKLQEEKPPLDQSPPTDQRAAAYLSKGGFWQTIW